MKTIKVSPGQTLENISVQEYGCLQGILLIVEDNGFSMDTLLYANQEVLIRDEVPELTENNREVAKYFLETGIKPNAGVVGEKPLQGVYEPGVYEEGVYE